MHDELIALVRELMNAQPERLRGEGEPMKTCTERNAAIAAMRRGGATYREIAERFGISADRARQVVSLAERRERRLADPMFRALLDAAERTGCPESTAARAHFALRFHGVHRLADLRGASDSELLGISGFGRKSLALARAAQETEKEASR